MMVNMKNLITKIAIKLSLQIYYRVYISTIKPLLKYMCGLYIELQLLCYKEQIAQLIIPLYIAKGG